MLYLVSDLVNINLRYGISSRNRPLLRVADSTGKRLFAHYGGNEEKTCA